MKIDVSQICTSHTLFLVSFASIVYIHSKIPNSIVKMMQNSSYLHLYPTTWSLFLSSRKIGKKHAHIHIMHENSTFHLASRGLVYVNTFISCSRHKCIYRMQYILLGENDRHKYCANIIYIFLKYKLKPGYNSLRWALVWFENLPEKY